MRKTLAIVIGITLTVSLIVLNIANIELYFGDKLLKQGRSIEQAHSWYISAAKRGNPRAQKLAADIYYRDDKLEESIDLYKKSAEQGYAPAQLALAGFYQQGNGVPKDFQKALNWYKKASDQGNPMAKYLLASMYYAGHGVKQSLTKANILFRDAAVHGSLNGQYTLALQYMRGEGVEQSYEKSYMWLTVAIIILSKKTDIDILTVILTGQIGQLVDDISEKMTLEEIKKASKMGEKCLNSNYKICG